MMPAERLASAHRRRKLHYQKVLRLQTANRALTKFAAKMKLQADIKAALVDSLKLQSKARDNSNRYRAIQMTALKEFLHEAIDLLKDDKFTVKVKLFLEEGV